LSDATKPRLALVPPVVGAPAEPVSRYQIYVGELNGWPTLELVDNVTEARMLLEVPDALDVAGNLAIATSAILQKLRRDAQPSNAGAPASRILRPGIDPV